MSGADAGSNVNGASLFSTDGSAASQFTMPGGGQAQPQGVNMMPATLGGAQGVADAQDYNQMVGQFGGGMTDANWQQIAQKFAGMKGLPGQNGGGQGGGMAGGLGGGARGAGGMSFTPSQMNVNPQAAGQNPQANVQSLLAMLQQGGQSFGSIPR